MDTLVRALPGDTEGPASVSSAVSQSDDDTRNGSSPTTSPSPAESPMPFLSLAEKALTPLSMADSDLSFDKDKEAHDMHEQQIRSSDNATTPTTSITSAPPDTRSARSAHSAHSTDRQSPQSPIRALRQHRNNPPVGTAASATGDSPLLPSPEKTISDATARPDGDPAPLRVPSSLPNKTTVPASPISPISPTTKTSSASSLAHARSRRKNQKQDSIASSFGSFSSSFDESQLFIRTASNSTVSLCHPTPDLNTRSGAYVGNIAALEATAERLSMTSSIEDAIRELHDEQKRSESRRSSILQSTLANGNTITSSRNSLTRPPLFRQSSTASSIVDTNSAARQGGYSPGGYVLSPSHSLSGRLRSASRSSRGSRQEDEYASYSSGYLSRSGPGKGSQRSVRSTKLLLSEIAEMEPPVTLTKEVMDEADRAAAVVQDLEHTISTDGFDAPKTPTANLMQDEAQAHHELPPPPPPPHVQPVQSMSRNRYTNDDDRPTTAASMTTFEQAQTAFGDFDGVHCQPESESSPPPSPTGPQAPITQKNNRRVSQIPPLPRPEVGRPTTYFDSDSGNQMLYYPARVPAMLNLPPKLSKNHKTPGRDIRRSQVLSQMPEPNRKSAVWLPDPLEGHTSTSFLPDDAPQGHQRSTSGVDTIRNEPGTLDPAAQTQPVTASLEDLSGEPATGSETQPWPVDGDHKHPGPPNLDKLPPQLRASVFFDTPTQLPAIEVKNGSAMDTLDSILDASADAPVSAFTDHAFAGKLGSEVYGRANKGKKRAGQASGHAKTLSTASLGAKNRMTFLGLGKHKSNENEEEERRNTIMGSDVDGEAQRLADNADGEEEDDDDEDDEGEEYLGPPTTLLAELQIRKQQQKHRTRNRNGNTAGLHATLLELDAVAEQERKTRKTKRVNLAWEEAPEEEDSGDEDVPLGLLYNTAAAEANRPLGLMEQRELEDNEPLSRRRDRLHGRNPNVRITQLIPAPLNISGGGAPPAEDDVDDDEPLATRRRRLKGEDESLLPQARPVSMAFTSELLSQFGGDEKDQDKERKEENATPAEETLGQRRRRLQAEREAQGTSAQKRVSSLADLLGAHPAASRLDVPSNDRRKSGFMGGMFNDGMGGGTALPGVDPRTEELARLEEEARIVAEQNERMKHMRASMPQTVAQPSSNKPTAYMGGTFNDGMGGLGSDRAARRVISDPRAEERARLEEKERMVREQGRRMEGLRAQMPSEIPGLQRKSSAYMGGIFNDGTGGAATHQQQQRASMFVPNDGGMLGINGGMMAPPMGGYGPVAGGINMGMGGGPMNANMMGGGMPMGPAMQISMTGVQNDRVERWRHSVLP